MATWKKIITSGSKASLQEVSGSTGVLGARIQSTNLTSGRVTFAGTNGVLTDDSDLTFSGDTLTATKIGAFQAAGAINFSDQAMTNVDINSGAIDGTAIGGSSAAAGAFTTISATNDITANGNIVGDGSTNISSIAAITATGNISSSNTSTGSFGKLLGDASDLSNLPSGYTVANQGNNRIVTSVDSSNGNAEANLEFDGNNLLIKSTGKLYLNDAGGEHISGDGNILSIAGGNEIDLTATAIDINGNVDISGNTVIAGDLTVNGTTTTIESVNLAVSESLILLASGSSGANVDAGILVQSGSVVGSGSVLYHDTDDERWAVAKGVAQNASTISPNRFVTTVKVSTASPSGTEYGVGEMWVDTNEDDGAGNGTIYILTAE